MPAHKTPDAELRKDVEAYVASGGNVSEAARVRKVKRQTFQTRLRTAQARLGVRLGKIVDGQLTQTQAAKRPLPKGSGVARYILSSCQNNTHPHHVAHEGLLTYCNWLDKRPGDSCEYVLGSFSYAIDAYGAKATKRGTFEEKRKIGALGQLWYAPELVPYIADEPIELAPGLMWCGEQNILPTVKWPLEGLDDYNGRSSNIVPHVKHQMESIASLPDEATKFNYTTGTVTQRNYIKKRAGIVAERWHQYGALIVEVDSAGNWYVRQIQIADDGTFYDIGPAGYASVRVQGGKLEALKAGSANSHVEAITWGDVHAAEMDLWVRRLGWDRGGMLDQLRPRKQFWHDIFSMRSASHHDLKNFHRSFEKYIDGESSVEDELRVTADFGTYANRPWCETFVVRSNHDRHLDRWLNEADPKRDPANAFTHSLLQTRKLEAIATGDKGFNLLEWALRRHGLPERILFLGEDESFVICKKYNGGIECGLHGDLGPGGRPGSTTSLLKLARPANKAHDHRATIRRGVFSAGVCALSFPYMRGPHAASISHIITFENAARQILTMWQGKFRA